jgi:undecaprenyl diphosphate synthase
VSQFLSHETVDLGADLADSALRHLMVVGGDFADWDRLGPDRWQARVRELGAVVAAAGGSWLTLRSYRAGPDPVDLSMWTHTVQVDDDDAVRTCTVIVDPCADGRQRFADAMALLDPSVEVNEATVATALYDPADCEPDAVLILGPPTRLPPSLVWELAYAELVFIDLEWDQLRAEHVVRAIRDFAGRRRRFGGLDP